MKQIVEKIAKKLGTEVGKAIEEQVKAIAETVASEAQDVRARILSSVRWHAIFDPPNRPEKADYVLTYAAEKCGMRLMDGIKPSNFEINLFRLSREVPARHLAVMEYNEDLEPFLKEVLMNTGDFKFAPLTLMVLACLEHKEEIQKLGGKIRCYEWYTKYERTKDATPPAHYGTFFFSVGEDGQLEMEYIEREDARRLPCKLFTMILLPV